MEKKYPKLLNILINLQWLPKNELMVNNIDIGGEWFKINFYKQNNMTEISNYFSPIDTIFNRSKNGFQINKESSIIKNGFKQIEICKIGLLK